MAGQAQAGCRISRIPSHLSNETDTAAGGDAAVTP
jgi:hypothetical protein